MFLYLFLALVLIPLNVYVVLFKNKYVNSPFDNPMPSNKLPGFLSVMFSVLSFALVFYYF